MAHTKALKGHQMGQIRLDFFNFSPPCFLTALIQRSLKAERAERTFAEAASNLAKEVPEFDELEAENYVPVGKQDFLGLTIRELANGLAAVETTRQQRCYKDISAAKSATQEFRQDGRWTLKGLIVAIERSSAK